MVLHSLASIKSITDIDTCKGNASALPSFYGKGPAGPIFLQADSRKGWSGWRGGIPPYAGEPPVS